MICSSQYSSPNTHQANENRKKNFIKFKWSVQKKKKKKKSYLIFKLTDTLKIYIFIYGMVGMSKILITS